MAGHWRKRRWDDPSFHVAPVPGVPADWGGCCGQFGSRILYNQWCDFSTAVILAYLTGMVTAFVLARMFVFTKQPVHAPLGAVFHAGQPGCGDTDLADQHGPGTLPVAHARVTHFSREIAHAIGVAAPVFTSYLGHKRWSFR
jgi:hypothetical protein